MHSPLETQSMHELAAMHCSLGVKAVKRFAKQPRFAMTSTVKVQELQCESCWQCKPVPLQDP